MTGSGGVDQASTNRLHPDSHLRIVDVGMSTIGPVWRDVQLRMEARRTERRTRDRHRDIRVAVGELCPGCYRSRRGPEVGPAKTWTQCGRQFHLTDAV